MPARAPAIAAGQAAVDQARAQVEAAQAAVQLAQADLAAATLVAPIDGTVAQVNYAAGQFVPRGTAGTSTSTTSNTSATAFIVLTDLDHLEVVAQVNEADVGKVTAGDHVRTPSRRGAFAPSGPRAAIL
jgi:multidrug resistance efflux pump